MAYIYCIENTETGKKYVGQTIRNDVNERYDEHIKNARKCSNKLGTSLREYGTRFHKISILEECLEDEIYERETYWIYHLNTIDEGLNHQVSFSPSDKTWWDNQIIAKENIKNGIIWNKGLSPPNYVRDKIRKTKKERYEQGLYANSYGHIHTDETKNHLSIVAKESYANGRINPMANFYDIITEDEVITNVLKQDIKQRFNMSEKEWYSCTAWCRRCVGTHLHPKFKIRITNSRRHNHAG